MLSGPGTKSCLTLTIIVYEIGCQPRLTQHALVGLVLLSIAFVGRRDDLGVLRLALSVSEGTPSLRRHPRAELDFIHSCDGETDPTFGQFGVSGILSCIVF